MMRFYVINVIAWRGSFLRIDLKSLSQPTFPCSNSSMETPEQWVKSAQS